VLHLAAGFKNFQTLDGEIGLSWANSIEGSRESLNYDLSISNAIYSRQLSANLDEIAPFISRAYYLEQTPDGVFEISNYTVEREADNLIKIAFDMQTPEFGNTRLQVETLKAFYDVCPTEGILQITAQDSSKLTIDAASGNEKTFLLTLEADQSVNALELGWTEKNSFDMVLSVPIPGTSSTTPTFHRCR